MADILLEVTIPDAHTTTVLAAFDAIAGNRMTIENSDPPVGSHGHFEFSIDPKVDGGETDKQFGERVTRELIKSIIKMVDKSEDETRYRTDIAAVSPAAEDVDEGVVI